MHIITLNSDFSIERGQASFTGYSTFRPASRAGIMENSTVIMPALGQASSNYAGPRAGIMDAEVENLNFRFTMLK